MTIGSRLVAAAAVSVVLIVAMVIAISVQAIRSQVIPGETAQLRAAAERQASGLVERARSVRADILVARDAGELATLLKEPGSSDYLAELEDARRVFLALAEANPDYLQLRVLGAPPRGREILRIERRSFGESPRVVPESELQDKGDRPYYRDALALAPGRVLISPIELNQEYGQIELPYTPVLRAAVAVRSSAEQILGIVVINLDLGRALEALSATDTELAYLVDEQGRVLWHPDPKLRFAHEFGKAVTLEAEYPGVATALASPAPSIHELAGSDGIRRIIALEPLLLADERRVILLVAAPSFGGGAARIAADRLIMAGLALLVLVALGALLYARSISRPMRDISAAARDFPNPGALPLPTQRSDEIGVLARALALAGSELSRKTAEIHSQENRFRSVVDAAPICLILVDAAQRIVLINPFGEKLFGYSQDELSGRPVHTLLPARLRSQHAPLVDQFLHQPAARAMGTGRELYGTTKDGEEFPVEVGLQPLDTREGRFVLASVIDIRERLAVQTTRNRIAAIVDSSLDAIIGLTLDGLITSWNRSAEILYGYRADEVLGRSIEVVIPESLRAEEAVILARIRRGERIQPLETIRRHKSGHEIHVSITLSPVHGATGQLVGAAKIARDVTNAKLRDAELQRSNAELAQFAYIASHDLQEPLRMVANFTELLARKYEGKLDEQADRYIHFASDGARRMQKMVTDLLAYSRVGSAGRPLHPVASEEVIERVVRSLDATMRDANATVDWQDLPVVLADEVQLQQLFQNLISNAIKFRGTAAPRIDICAQRAGSLWRFSVADNGIGFKMEYAERIFQMFRRLSTSGEYEGSGIGLAISKRIVERHGGTIWVESMPGAGTTFHFTLRDSGDSP